MNEIEHTLTVAQHRAKKNIMPTRTGVCMYCRADPHSTAARHNWCELNEIVGGAGGSSGPSVTPLRLVSPQTRLRLRDRWFALPPYRDVLQSALGVVPPGCRPPGSMGFRLFSAVHFLAFAPSGTCPVWRLPYFWHLPRLALAPLGAYPIFGICPVWHLPSSKLVFWD